MSGFEKTHKTKQHNTAKPPGAQSNKQRTRAQQREGQQRGARVLLSCRLFVLLSHEWLLTASSRQTGKKESKKRLVLHLHLSSAGSSLGAGGWLAAAVLNLVVLFVFLNNLPSCVAPVKQRCALRQCLAELAHVRVLN